jgi:hypothetical protein
MKTGYWFLKTSQEGFLGLEFNARSFLDLRYWIMLCQRRRLGITRYVFSLQ